MTIIANGIAPSIALSIARVHYTYGDTHMTRTTRLLLATASLLFSTTTLVYAQSEPSTVHPVLHAYYDVKNALVSSDSIHVKADGAALLAALADVDTTSLSASDKSALARMKTSAQHISSTTELTHQRQHFVTLSNDMITVARDAKWGKGYVQFCPMANGGKGAVWLNQTKPINNPYLGGSMKGCGSVKDTLK
jgi:hypothetical protein